ncbi:MAG: hypothetical protein ACLR76_03690 [Alistipes sp.]
MTIIAFVTFGSVFQAEAKKPEDQEFRRVVVTLDDGKTVEGYLKSDWHADDALLKIKRENYSFTLTPTPDSRETARYTAERCEASNIPRNRIRSRRHSLGIASRGGPEHQKPL